MRTIENNFGFKYRSQLVAYLNSNGMKLSLNTANNWANGHTAAATEHIAAAARILRLTDEEVAYWVRSCDPGWGIGLMGTQLTSKDTNCY